MKQVARERGSTYIFVGTPDESRRREILRGSLVSRLVRELPGIDIRVVADRALREEEQPMTFWLVAAIAAVLAARARRGRRCRRRPRIDRRDRVARILVPFTGGALDPTVLTAAIRIARAEDATLVPAYLIVIPLELAEDAPMQQQVESAMPLLEAVEHAALRGGVPVDARVESGRTPDPRAAAALGRRSTSTGSSSRRRPGAGRGFAAEGPDVDAHARAEPDADPAPGSGAQTAPERSWSRARSARRAATFGVEHPLNEFTARRRSSRVQAERARRPSWQTSNDRPRPTTRST